MDKKLFIFGLACLSLSLPAIAAGEDVDMTPGASETVPEKGPPIPKLPARAPQVTITDGALLTVDRIAEDASLVIEILRDGESIFSTFTVEHSVAIPLLDCQHTYTILLTAPVTSPIKR